MMDVLLVCALYYENYCVTMHELWYIWYVVSMTEHVLALLFWVAIIMEEYVEAMYIIEFSLTNSITV